MRVSEVFRIRVGVRVGLLAALATWLGCTGDTSESAAFGPSNDGNNSATGGTTGSGIGVSSGGSPAVTPPPLPPEKEKESSFKLPVQSGRWVWAANPDSGKVSVIDTRSLEVQLARAGFAPTYLAALPTGNDVTSAAIVLNAKSDDATIIRRRESSLDTATVPTHVGANSWAVSPGGRWAIAWSDASVVKDADSADSFQDITVIDTSEPPRAVRLSVGYRPNRIFFQDDESRAFVVSEPGISVIELASGDPSVSSDVALSESPNDKALDVSVLPDGSSALFRVEGSPRLGIVQLPSGERSSVTLSGPITDLDLVADGASAIAVVRGQPIVVGASGSGGAGGITAGSGGSSGGTVATNAGSGGTTASSGGATVSLGGSISAGGVSDAGASGAAGNEDGFGNGGDGASGESAGGALGQGGESDGGFGGDLDVGGQGAVGGSGAEAGAGGVSGLGGSPGGGMPPASGYGPSEIAVLSVKDVILNPKRFDSVLLSDLVGSVAVSSDGTRAVLYTTATDLDRVTALNTDPSDTDEYLSSRTVRVRAPVDAVFIAPDTGHALVALRAGAGATIGGAFGIVPLLAPLGVKVQPTDAPITGVAFAPSPSTSAILTAATGKTAYLVHFPALRVDLVPLPSLPLSAGIVAEENVGYVAQKHPDGRISLINLDTGEPRTLTGFELAGAVIDGN